MVDGSPIAERDSMVDGSPVAERDSMVDGSPVAERDSMVHGSPVAKGLSYAGSAIISGPDKRDTMIDGSPIAEGFSNAGEANDGLEYSGIRPDPDQVTEQTCSVSAAVVGWLSDQSNASEDSDCGLIRMG
jgi:hypothetical protein